MLKPEIFFVTPVDKLDSLPTLGEAIVKADEMRIANPHREWFVCQGVYKSEAPPLEPPAFPG